MNRSPNVVVCLCDMMRAFALGCYGNTHVKTPNLDRLASSGVRFELGISNDPVCVPARSSLISGQYARTCTGMLGNVNDRWPREKRERLCAPTIAECFRNAGYTTALFGKWHIDPDPTVCGFDTALYPNMIHRHYGQEYRWNRDEIFTVDEWAPDFELRELDRWLGAQGKTPFFLYHNISQPHMPVGPGNCPQRYLDMYDRDTVPLRPNVFQDDKLAHDEEWFLIYNDPDYWYRKWISNGPFKDTDCVPDGYDLRDLTAHYYALVSSVDDQVGSLLDSLEAHGHLENTILLFLSDHGDNLGSHGTFNKGILIEESIRVPYIFHAPRRVQSGSNSTQIAQTIDAMPTLLELAGLPRPAHCQGKSLAPVLRGECESLPENYAMIECPSRQIGIRTPTHLYGMELAENERDIANDTHQFYDLRTDPYEFKNLAGTQEQANLAEDLRERLRAWNADTPWLSCDPR